MGSAYTVISSRGHIKDLPKSKLGVDVENNFDPTYIKIRGKAKIIQSIKKTCTGAKLVYLAPDPDREGEAIAQHLAEILNSQSGQIKRLLFYEITPEHVQDALANPTEINKNLVDAHKARRVLDRLVGYYTSPILWAIIKRGLSAGRVQSVALRLICERENEINSFESTPYWTAEAEFITGKNEDFKAGLWQIDKTSRRINSVEELDKIKKILTRGAEFIVTSFRINHPQRTPPPPFITSTLQQEASKKFRFSAKKTMIIAQQLYEGVDLPQGRIGLISYMRTDSVRINENALKELRDKILDKYGKDYLTPNIRVFKDRKNAQSGHEAIHPTKIKIEPDQIKESLTPDQYRIYKLIYDRFFASQMANAKYLQKEAIVSCQNIDFRSEESKPAFLGYQVMSGDVIERGYVPDLVIGETVTLKNIEFIEKKTEPAPRYTEASLIKKMEENGVGRPSTYAHIMDTLFNRYYITKTDNKIQATELGMQVYDILIPRFDDIFEVTFTADMEKDLDRIETGQISWTDVLHRFYGPFIAKLNATRKEVEELKSQMTETVDKNCPNCQRPLVVKWGKFGKFLACSGFPECKYSENLDVEKIDKKCPKCGRDIIVRHGKFGKFLACSGYPECKHTENMIHDVPCPRCGDEISIISTKKGRLFKCKSCDLVSFYPPIQGKCPKCGKGLVLKKNEKLCIDCDNVLKKPRKKK